MNEPFRVGLTRDARRADGALTLGDLGLSVLEEAPGVEWDFLGEAAGELTPALIAGYDALIVVGSRVTAATVDGADRLTVVARVGVGYDNVDVDALTRNGVLLTNTPDGVRRPMASAALALLLALAHRLLIKDRLTRAGRWHEQYDHIGTGLTGRALGVVGIGNIGAEFLALTEPLGMRRLAADPYVSAETASAHGAELVEIDDLFREADFVVVMCPLTEQTRRLVDARRIALMKPTAFLINVARGPIVDQRALTEALSEGRIAGAALDVFEQEPIAPDDPLLTLENVIVTPHAIGGTDEEYLLCGGGACASVLDVAQGRVPQYVVNREVLGSPLLEEKLRRYKGVPA